MRAPKILLLGDRRLAAFTRPDPDGTETQIVGWREWVALPELGIARVKAKMDTGARSSALHANSIEPYEHNGAPCVRFDVMGEAENVPWHEAPVADRRLVRSSNGETELRYVIRTALSIAGQTWPVDITLTNRERMDLPMLIGREALAGRALVDPQRSWLCGRPHWRSLEPRRAHRRSGDRP